MIILTQKRRKRGWSLAELARRAKMTAGDVGKIESGRLVPYPSQLKKLAHALGISTKQASTLTREILKNE